MEAEEHDHGGARRVQPLAPTVQGWDARTGSVRRGGGGCTGMHQVWLPHAPRLVSRLWASCGTGVLTVGACVGGDNRVCVVLSVTKPVFAPRAQPAVCRRASPTSRTRSSWRLPCRPARARPLKNKAGALTSPRCGAAPDVWCTYGCLAVARPVCPGQGSWVLQS